MSTNDTTQPPPPENSAEIVREITSVELSAPIAREMPPVTGSQETSTQPSPEFKLEPTPIQSEQIDEGGVKFNAAYHKTDENGKPLKRRGHFVRINSGRPSKEEAEALKSGKSEIPASSDQPAPVKPDPTPKSVVGGLPKSAPKQAPDTSPTVEPLRVDRKEEKRAEMLTKYHATADVYIGVLDGIASGIFGADAGLDQQDRDMIKPPLVAVMEEEGEIPLTPKQLLCCVLIAVAAKKAKHQSVRERALVLFLKIKGFFARKINA